MIAAIYSRKSIYTGKGESMENQVQMCKEYGKSLGVTEYIVYEDEGFSGGNIDRPQFQNLMKDAKKKKFDLLICYRLDRVSRNIADFSTLIEDLQKLDIGFVSIREQFDTSTPMGRAMMYIASVFAQLERETIAERVRDNMLELSKTGRWLGGVTPFGFTTNRIIEDEKEVTYLEPTEDIEKVKELFENYIELGSMHQIQKYLFKNYNQKWPLSTVRQVLTAPYYVQSSDEVVAYFQSLGITVVGSANGNGFVSYNKRPGKSTRRTTPSSEWIYAVSNHKGVIEPALWLQAQNLMIKNKRQPRAAKSENSYITGLIRCSICGSPLTINYNHTRKDGSKVFYYVCEGKRKYGKNYCNNANIRTEKLEKEILNHLEALSLNKELFKQEVSAKNIENSNIKELNKIRKAISKNDTAIQNLTKQLGQVIPEASQYIIQEINRLSKENSTLKESLLELENTEQNNNIKNLNRELLYDQIKRFNKVFKQCKTNDEKRILIQSIVDKIFWDGSTERIKVKILQ